MIRELQGSEAQCTHIVQRVEEDRLGSQIRDRSLPGIDIAVAK